VALELRDAGSCLPQVVLELLALGLQGANLGLLPLGVDQRTAALVLGLMMSTCAFASDARIASASVGGSARLFRGTRKPGHVREDALAILGDDGQQFAGVSLARASLAERLLSSCDVGFELVDPGAGDRRGRVELADLRERTRFRVGFPRARFGLRPLEEGAEVAYLGFEARHGRGCRTRGLERLGEAAGVLASHFPIRGEALALVATPDAIGDCRPESPSVSASAARRFQLGDGGDPRFLGPLAHLGRAARDLVRRAARRRG
jgi:hypothetical protein